MPRAALLTAFLVAPLTLAAQNTSSQPGNAAAQPDFKMQPPLVVNPLNLQVSELGVPRFNCPVSMHATQGVWDHTIRVRNGKAEIPQPFGQRVLLNLKDSQPARIIAATVRVRGMNGKNRVVETPATTDQNSNAMRTMRVTFTEENDGSFSSDIRVPGFTAVSSVQLLDVSYDDGAIVRSLGPPACNVTQPDPLMLISNR